MTWARPGQTASTIPASVLYSPLATLADVNATPVTTNPVTTNPVEMDGYSVADLWNYSIYYGNWINLPDFKAIVPSEFGTTDSLDIAIVPVNNKFAVRFTGTVEVGEAGVYTFYTSSDDGSRVLVDGQLVADNDGRHGTTEVLGQVLLTAGVHAVEWTYFQGFSGKSFTPSWSGPGFDKRVVVPGDSGAANASSGADAGDSSSTIDNPTMVATGDTALPQLQYQYF